jgi:archaellum component FlaC
MTYKEMYDYVTDIGGFYGDLSKLEDAFDSLLTVVTNMIDKVNDDIANIRKDVDTCKLRLNRSDSGVKEGIKALKS